MPKAPRSGRTVNSADIPVILGMIARGDRKHDIAAWFGLNQGRIAEVESEAPANPSIASAGNLPPNGSPGPRARFLRKEMDSVKRAIENGDVARAVGLIDAAIKDFDAAA